MDLLIALLTLAGAALASLSVWLRLRYFARVQAARRRIIIRQSKPDGTVLTVEVGADGDRIR